MSIRFLSLYGNFRALVCCVCVALVIIFGAQDIFAATQEESQVGGQAVPPTADQKDYSTLRELTQKIKEYSSKNSPEDLKALMQLVKRSIVFRGELKDRYFSEELQRNELMVKSASEANNAELVRLAHIELLDTRLLDHLYDDLEFRRELVKFAQKHHLNESAINLWESSASRAKEAIKCMESVRANSFRSCAVAAMLDGNLMSARQLLQESRALLGLDREFDLDLTLGDLALLMDDKAEAIRLANSVIQSVTATAPQKARALEQLANVHEDKKEARCAVEFLEKALSLESKAITRLNLAIRLADAQQLESAELQFKSGKSLATQEIKAIPTENVRESQISVYAALTAQYYMARRQWASALEEITLAIANVKSRIGLADAKLERCYIRSQLGAPIDSSDLREIEKSVAEIPCLKRKFHEYFPNAVKSERPIKNRWALIVGISKFADQSIPELRFASKDAQDMRNFLVEKAGFPAANVHLLLDQQATRQNVLEQLGDKWLPRVVGPDDLVFFFISSHGSPSAKDVAAANYLIAYDTSREHLFSQAIPMNVVSTMLADRVKAGCSFVVVDTCHSGRTAGLTEATLDSSDVNAQRLLTSMRQLVLCSSDARQKSWESRRYANGIFTRQLINELSNKPDYDDFKGVFNAIKLKVSREVSADHNATQTPSLAGIWSGAGLMRCQPDSK